MTGLERNSDIVHMTAYAPLFNKVGSSQWTPDLIWFNNTDVYGTPSYYVQKMFSTNLGDFVLPSTYEADESAPEEEPISAESVGRRTRVSLTGSVTSGDSAGRPLRGWGVQWRLRGGQRSEGVMEQLIIDDDCRMFAGARTARHHDRVTHEVSGLKVRSLWREGPSTGGIWAVGTTPSPLSRRR